MQKIKTGDRVIIIAGKDKGKQGNVIRLLKNQRGHILRVVVEGINMMTKHERANPKLQKAGGLIKREAPLHISNVGLCNIDTNLVDRVGIKTLEDGRKVRYYKSNGEVIDG